MKKLITHIIGVGCVGIAALVFLNQPMPFLHTNSEKTLSAFIEKKVTAMPSPTPSVAVKPTPGAYSLVSGGFISQTFNNCGPATLSMTFAHFGKHVSQDELGNQMRPYQNPIGDNDDKSVSVDEFVSYAKKYGFESIARPNGDIDLLKKFVANDIPVVVRTWLHPGEDIGHFRIVRGYDDARRVLIQDDSYEGPNLEFNYDTFNTMWQPFNYGYILVYPKEKQQIVEAILGEDMDEMVAYKNSITRAEKEIKSQPDNVYPVFNLSSAYYHLGENKKSIEEYSKVESRLPSRMLWYQIEPIRAFAGLGNSDKVFSLTNVILNNNNRAFSELYELRGEMYLKDGNKEAAKSEFEQAILYNKNYQTAKDSLNKLE